MEDSRNPILPTPPRNPISRNPILPTSVQAPPSPPTPPPVESPGYGFNPTDKELVGFYLRKKVMGEPLGRCEIGEKDVYAEEPPWQICGEGTQPYVFTVLKKKWKKGARIDRCTKAGASWKPEGKKKSIQIGDGEVAGYKETFSYVKVKDGKLGERLASPDGHNWLMHQYSLASYPDDGAQIVLCRLKRGRVASVKNKPPKSALHGEVSTLNAAADDYVSSPSPPPMEECHGLGSPSPMEPTEVDVEHQPRWAKFSAAFCSTLKSLFA